jgi:hypothetical protein
MNIVDAAMEVLRELRPENVDLDAVTVTGEGAAMEIILVPHRDLGGVALIVWTDEGSTQLSWAQVHDLSTHDDLDLGVVVARIPHEGDWFPRLRDALAAEIRRPIRLKWRRGLLGRAHVDCVVTVDGKDKRLAVLDPSTRHSSSGSEMTGIVTSLASGPPLPFSIPPPLDNWRRWR